ncbi:hypothetical protein HYT25_01130 [Candidatus Pacearchaeota archaeon]|nr:hypothetical protein [Candidatus Pacearchaeota archaeon]
MNLQFYLEKLRNHEDFKKFKKENPKAYLCSVFISIDKEKNQNEVHFDFFLPETKGITSFQMNEEIRKIPLEKYDDKTPEELSDIKMDFNEIETLISEKMERESIKNKIQKIILSLQKANGREFLAGTVFISMLGLIKINIEISEMKILDFEKKSLLDIINVMKKK